MFRRSVKKKEIEKSDRCMGLSDASDMCIVKCTCTSDDDYKESLKCIFVNVLHWLFAISCRLFESLFS